MLHLLKIKSVSRLRKERLFPIPKVWGQVSRYISLLCKLIYSTNSLTSSRSKLIHNFICRLVRFESSHGTLLTIKWLKCSHVAIQRYLSGRPLKSLRELEKDIFLPRLTNGLPSVLPRSIRSAIRKGDVPSIKFALTLFNLSRVCVCPPVPKLETITAPFSGSEKVLNSFLCFIYSPLGHVFQVLPGYFGWERKVDITPKNLSFSSSASPSCSVSWHGFLTDAMRLRSSPVWSSFEAYLDLFKTVHPSLEKVVRSCPLRDTLDLVFELCDEIVLVIKETIVKNQGFIPDNFQFDPCVKSSSRSGFLGQLSFKEEAAGKLRVFAIVDSWTQSALKPLHLELFKLLKMFPNDGTFNQDESVFRSMEKMNKSGKAYSFDLSAATDRLPLSIQSAILQRLFPGYPGIGQAWSSLLVDRDYFVAANREGELPYGLKEGVYRYSVGQPMGALSSWAMLAVTHHYILQYLSHGGTGAWEQNYEILGDDLVIFSDTLANSYVDFMRDLGLDINMSKSLISDEGSCFEFAKRTVTKAGDVSGVSWQQLLSATSLSARITNVLAFSRQIRTVSCLISVLCGKIRSVKDLDFPIISLLGSLLFKKISPRDLLTTLTDISKGRFLPEEASLPYQTTLVAIRDVLSGKPYIIPQKQGEFVNTPLDLDWDACELFWKKSLLFKAAKSYVRIMTSYWDLVKTPVAFSSLPYKVFRRKGGFAGRMLYSWGSSFEGNCLIDRLDHLFTQELLYPSDQVVDWDSKLSHILERSYARCTEDLPWEEVLSITDEADSWEQKFGVIVGAEIRKEWKSEKIPTYFRDILRGSELGRYFDAESEFPTLARFSRVYMSKFKSDKEILEEMYSSK